MLSITMKESLFHVKMLASDEFQGREAGTAGQWLAAKYIANEFAKYGLLPVGDNHTYYQHFKIVRSDLRQAELTVWTQKKHGYQETKYAVQTDFIPLSFTGENALNAPVVFAGYGISAPEYGYDDYQGIDVMDKIVLVLRHEPQENYVKSPFAGLELTRHAQLSVKAQNARAHGAVGLLVVSDPASGHSNLAPQGFWPAFFPDNKYPETWRLVATDRAEDFPALWIDNEIANKLLRPQRYSLVKLQESIDTFLQPVSFEIKGVRLSVKVTLRKDLRKTQNVLGLLPGSDALLKHQLVVVGAHYDHLGIKKGKIYPGADDNASGTAGLLEIAEAFSETPVLPRRSILFAAFSAEELGLLGSEYYVLNPVRPLKQSVSMLNLDMISRNADNQVSIIGGNRSPELQAINEAANRKIGLELLYNGEKYFSRSDQASFAKHKVPVLFYNTDTHDDYHQPSDLAEKINPEKLARIARLAFLVAWEVVNADVAPTVQRVEVSEKSDRLRSVVVR
ncbi:MAG: M28 family peptidase [bacterium]